MTRTVIYFIERPADRWFQGDHKWRAPIRRLLRSPDPISGVKSVFVNLCKGLDRLGADYVTNIPFSDIRPTDRVGVIGLGTGCLAGYKQSNPLLVGVAVAAHPTEWPTMFDDFPVAACVVASEWVKNMFEPYYGEKLSIWPTGIDTQSWIPSKGDSKSHDLLIYEKVRWDRDRVQRALVEPIVDQIRKLGLTYRFISYGRYDSAEYRVALNSSRAMLFLCEHESQGLAYQEAMSCDVPVLAWDPGQWLDPWRYRYGEGFVPATSVPYFDQRCGMSFTGLRDFGYKLNTFLQGLDSRCFRPRDFVLESLTLECCAQRYLDLLEEHCG